MSVPKDTTTTEVMGADPKPFGERRTQRGHADLSAVSDVFKLAFEINVDDPRALSMVSYEQTSAFVRALRLAAPIACAAAELFAKSDEGATSDELKAPLRALATYTRPIMGGE